MKEEYKLEENPASFENGTSPSKLTHLTKDRPKFQGRNSLKEKRPKKITKGLRKNAEENEEALFVQNSPKQQLDGKLQQPTPSKKVSRSLPPTSPKPQPKQFIKPLNNNKEHDNELKQRISKKKTSFKHPGLGNNIFEKSKKNGKEREDAKKKTDVIKLIKYEENVDTTDGISLFIEEKPAPTLLQVKKSVNSSTNEKKSFKDSEKQSSYKTVVENNNQTNDSNESSFHKQTVARSKSVSTGRDVKSLRAKLESRSNSFRRGINRIGSSVSTKTHQRVTSKRPLNENKALLIDDPDEIIDQLLKEKNEKQTITHEKEKTKEKKKLSGQSVRITKQEKAKPIVPTYKRLHSSPGSPRKVSPTVNILVEEEKEKAKETYKRLPSSPSAYRKPSNDILETLEMPEETFLEKTKTQQPDNTMASTTTTEREQEGKVPLYLERNNNTIKPIGENIEIQSTQITTKARKSMTKTSLTEEIINTSEEIICKDNSNTDTTICKDLVTEPPTRDTHKRKIVQQPVNTQKKQQHFEQVTHHNKDDSKNNKNTRSPLFRSFTWNSYKPLNKNNRNISSTPPSTTKHHPVNECNISHENTYTPPVVRRSYSIVTYTPNIVRRKLDSQGRLLNKKGCAKNNILESLSFSGNKENQQQKETPHKYTAEPPRHTVDMQTSLYEDSFKQSNARKISEDSWLGKCNLLNFETDQSKIKLVEPATTTKETNRVKGNQQQEKYYNTEKENLLQDDSDDEDQLLNQQIATKNTNNNNTPYSLPSTSFTKKEPKKKMASSLSFRKKYNFEKL